MIGFTIALMSLGLTQGNEQLKGRLAILVAQGNVQRRRVEDDCFDVGIPEPVKVLYPTCADACGVESFAENICRKTCGKCVGFELSTDKCDRDALAVEMRDIVKENLDFAKHCIEMQAHFQEIFNDQDDLVGIPDYPLLCSCLSQFPEAFAKDSLNCELGGVNGYELYKDDCPALDKVFVKKTDKCDRDALSEKMIEVIKKNFDFAKPCIKMQKHFKEELFNDKDELVGTPNNAVICSCLSQFDDTFAQESFNCELGGEHGYELYRDTCPNMVKCSSNKSEDLCTGDCRWEGGKCRKPCSAFTKRSKCRAGCSWNTQDKICETAQ